ncbi:MAG TPA: hypothetical protein VK831_02865 [Candidatus Deferrimicrobiaceae bacterium]|nr:hypothetical protein [Candidatus Deferrimicrobiaceae bacterium]
MKAAISVDSGALEVTTLLRVQNESGGGIDHLELNTLAARVGGLRVIEATVDDTPVDVEVDDQTITVPLGRILPDGDSTLVRIGYRARLRGGLADPDWMFSRAGGTLVLYRWIPWVSRALPFNRPNDGQPFVTPSSPRVDVEIVTDAPMVLAAPTGQVVRAGVGGGGAWSFSMQDVRDVSVVLAPDFKVLEGEAGGVTIRVYTPAGSTNRQRLLSMARDAVIGQTRLLGLDFPRSFLAVVETEGGEALEAPGLIWVPRTDDTVNRTYQVHQKVAHQWFYDLVGNDQRADPFADEAPADLLARTVLGSFRPSRCSISPLDRGLGGYAGGCYYEVVNVQGGLLLNEVRRRIGSEAFWGALRGYIEANRLGLAGTSTLLEALRAASEVNLLPLFRSRFPSLY